MTYSVLLRLGSTGAIRSLISVELGKHTSELSRLAFLTPKADAGAENEARYKKVVEARLERIKGSLLI